jgi:hypothetical protein
VFRQGHSAMGHQCNSLLNMHDRQEAWSKLLLLCRVLLLCKEAFAPEPLRPDMAEPLYGEHPDVVSNASV